MFPKGAGASAEVGAGEMVTLSVAAPEPAAFVREMATGKLPSSVGVPEMMPLVC